MSFPAGSVLAEPQCPSVQPAQLLSSAEERGGVRIRITQGPFRGCFGDLSDSDESVCLIRVTDFPDGTYVRIPTNQIVEV
jgi:hypothetical protein